MDLNKYTERLIETHKKIMAEIDREYPPLILNSRLVSQEKLPSGFKTTFQIINTNHKIKLSSIIEDKLFIDDSYTIKGTVVDYYENKIVVNISRKLEEREYKLKRHSNYNNEILLEKALNFIESGKHIHECLYSPSSLEGVPISSDIVLFNKLLNNSQKSAVFTAMGNSPFKILGPPGTGKTETIVEIICQLLNRKKTILVCGPSNISVDNIIEKFLKTDYYKNNTTSFYRLGSSTKGLVHLNLEYMADEAVNFMDDEKKSYSKKSHKSEKKSQDQKSFAKDKMERRKEFISNLKKNSPIVFATLFSSLKESHYFDVCIVDEACQATELECFLGIVKAKTFILAGDPNQLCPDYQSLYERVNLPIIILKEQYRMHKEIISFSNSFFYQGLILSNKNDNFAFFDKSKILFIDTSYFDYREENYETSKINTEEANIIVECAKWIRSKDSEGSIGIITPYSAQVMLLREDIDSISNCTVNTVDGFQGQEREFIILGLVRSNEDLEYGFLSDKKRLNVAITRCKKGLIVVGDSENFRNSDFFKTFFDHLNKNALIMDPDTFKMSITQ